MGYALRERLRWPGREPRRERGAELPLSRRARELDERYGLLERVAPVSRTTLDECLGALDLLDRLPGFAVPASASGSLRALDVGAQGWRYLGALDRWIHHTFDPSSLTLTGVELDAFRLAPDLTTRFSVGRYFAERLSAPGARYRYVPGDVLEFQEKVHLCTWLFPFVTPDPHRAWGLPARLFQPEESFAHVASLLVPGGGLVLANQGEWEAEAAHRLLKSRLQLIHSQEIEGSLHRSSYPIYLTLWTRKSQ